MKKQGRQKVRKINLIYLLIYLIMMVGMLGFTPPSLGFVEYSTFSPNAFPSNRQSLPLTGETPVQQFSNLSTNPSSAAAESDVPIPQINVTLNVLNCVAWELCQKSPQLLFLADINIETAKITQVTIRIGDIEKVYLGQDALLTLPETGEQGNWIEFWADSDIEKLQGKHYKIKYRLVKSPADQSSFQFDLIGEQWADMVPDGSLIWGIFPPITGSLPKALDPPFTSQYLFTTNRYIYLAGNLIKSGISQAKSCPNNGLDANGSATSCGEKTSAAQVLEWQNKYDMQIFLSSEKYHIPARVLKGIIAQESQFWPISDDPYELGLGHFTANGADLVLMWNTSYYLSACIPIYGEISCSSGYSNLSADKKVMLRGWIMKQINTESEIDLLAASLLASANQINQMVKNTTGNEPANLTSYEVMWKMTTGNYYSGSGCIGPALQKINDDALQLTWEELIAQMDGVCKTSNSYVDKVFGATE